MALSGKPSPSEILSPGQPALGAPLDESALAAYGSDISFISDDGTPADSLVFAAIDQAPAAELKRCIGSLFDRLRGEYESRSISPHATKLLAWIHETMSTCGLADNPAQVQSLARFLDRVNRTLFQHQTLNWLADSEFKIRIYGAGWDRNPTFASRARGPVADSATLRTIWHASQINLAAFPYGALSPQVLDGVAAGGFFLMRFCPADVIERFYPPLVEFCRQHHISTNAQFRAVATRSMRRLVGFASNTLAINILGEWHDFIPHVLATAASNRARSAAAIWADYPSIAFSSRDELLSLCTKYLYDVPLRQTLAERMRKQLADAQHRVRVSVDRAALAEMSPAPSAGAADGRVAVAPAPGSDQEAAA